MTSSPGLDGARAQARRRERVEGHQVGRRAGVHAQRMLHADEGGQLALELRVEAAGGQPAVQRGLDHQLQFLDADHLAGRRDDGLTPGWKPAGACASSAYCCGPAWRSVRAGRGSCRCLHQARCLGSLQSVPGSGPAASCAGQPAAVPFHRQAAAHVPASRRGRPGQALAGQAGVQLQPAVASCGWWPGLHVGTAHHRPSAHGPARRPRRPPGGHRRRGDRNSRPARRSVSSASRRSASMQVAVQRLQHVLPRAHGVRVAKLHRLAAAEGARSTSGTRRSRAQSPPPITLPARAVASATPCAARKDAR